MKNLLMLATVALVGCATFTTTQTDISYENGKKTREVTTRASARDFFEAKSELTKFKALQTDKTQSASVGSLNQEANGSNAVSFASAVAAAVTEAAIKSAKP